jgi:DNA-binding NtrC family response regulator
MRPILLVIDPPDPETLSTRKLILESQKYNVLTAFTGPEAKEIAERVPINAVVLHDHVQDGDSKQLAGELKHVRPEVPIWMVTPHPHVNVPNVDQVLSSFEPLALVVLAEQTFGNYIVKDESLREQNPPPSKRSS